MKNIHSLTGLRGLAALIVFICHAANHAMLPAIFGSGFAQSGVMLFFVLSGFLMAHLYIQQPFTINHVLKYTLARVGRIVPLYIMLVLLSVILTAYIDHEFYYKFTDASQIVAALSFIKAPYAFWTIPVEVQFYAVFVGFWYLFKAGKSALILAMYVFLISTPAIYSYWLYDEVPIMLPSFAVTFFVGVFTAIIYDKLRRNDKISTICNIAYYPLLILLFMNLPVLRKRLGLIDEITYGTIYGDLGTWIIVYGLFFCAICGRPNAFLNSKIMVHLGTVSYGFYLMHSPVIQYFYNMSINSAFATICAFTVTIVLASLSFYYFEKPIGALIRNFNTPITKRLYRFKCLKT